MTFDPITGGALLFGGSSATAPLLSNETWTFDGANWTLRSPGTSPSARSGAQLVYDWGRGVAVLYGGLATSISIPPPVSDTWEWNGTTWTQAAPTASAGPRYLYGASYDLARQRVVMYGGKTTQLLGTPNNETWEYDGTTWTRITTTGNPGPRERPAMCYHAGFNRTVMFGGFDGTNLTNSTWIYDGSTWAQVPVTGSVPPARNAARMEYDSVRNVCVLMGGQDTVGALSDTWILDGSTWIQQPGTTQAGRDHMTAFLPSTKTTVRFGGFVSGPFTLSNQTWDLGTGVYGVGCPGTNGVPSLVATSAPRLAQPWTLNLANLNPSINFAAIVFGFTKLPGIDLGPVLGMPGCLAFTTPDILELTTGAGGTASWNWSAVSGIASAVFYAQALSLDPSVNSFGYAVSNALFATIEN